MSETGTTPDAPGRLLGWLKAALVASLAVNLLFVGAGVARWYVGFGPDRAPRMTQMQLIPRFFFHDLDRARRLELLQVFKAHDKDIRDGRQAMKAQVIALADALEAEPYDPARVKAEVEAFTAKSEALFVTGSDAALALIEKLSPEERKLLAQHLRSREQRGRGKPADGGKPHAP